MEEKSFVANAIPLPVTVVKGGRQGGSSRAVNTADAGRGRSFLDGLKDCRIDLPPLPTGEGLKTMVVLHCDTAGRPCRIEDFRQPMKEAGVIEQVGGIGAQQMSHAWVVSFRSEEAKLDTGHITVKEKTCVVFDPERHEVRLKVHWCAFNVSNETLWRAFADYGEVKEVSSDRWKTGVFENADSTTRVVRLVLREGASLERLPHQMRIGNGTVLVLEPGRTPICVRCRNTGHVRRDCKVPKCSQCHAYGHEEAECMKSYARAAGRGTLGENSELHMDEVEVEQAASNPVVETITAALQETKIESQDQTDSMCDVMGHRVRATNLVRFPKPPARFGHCGAERHGGFQRWTFPA
ncbi:uncharacterized protein LOC144126338 [Amblyomma americanum]